VQNSLLAPRPEDWLYSNYLEWIGERSGTLKDEEFIHQYFSDPEAYKQFVTDYQDVARTQEQIQRYM
jgi:REP-associated tyrosine transposase